MRLQGKGSPDAADRRLVQARGLGHRTSRPVRGPDRLALERARDHRFYLSVAQLARLAGARLIQQAVETGVAIPAPPLAHRLNADTQFGGQRRRRQSARAAQDDARAQRQGLRSLPPPRPTLQCRTIRIRQYQRR
jgi:hypothetical protein